MIDILFGLGPLALPLIMLVVFGGLGYLREKKHLVELDRRESQVAHLLLASTPTLPAGARVISLATGNVVLGTDYLKQFMASIRGVFGGEVVGYQKVLDRARREASLRMLESAAAQNARGVLNVRFETADISGKQASSEIFCYGTMIA